MLLKRHGKKEKRVVSSDQMNTGDWLRKHLSNLSISDEEMDKLLKAGDNQFNEFNSWAPLKLVFLKYCITVYARIITKRPEIKNMYYVDLLAGSGINKIKGNDKYFLGSPLILAKKISPYYKFKKMFFVEKNPMYSTALQNRLQLYLEPNDFQVIQEDCNNAISNIKDNLESPYHCLIFADPFSTQLDWTTLEDLLGLNSDIILNFQTTAIPRSQEGEAFKRIFKDYKKALEICDTSPRGSIREGLLQLYIDDIRQSDKKRGGILIETANVHSVRKGGFNYDLLFITRFTSGKSPWIGAISDAKAYIEKNSDKTVDLAMDILFNGQKVLDTKEKEKQDNKQAKLFK